MFGFSCMLRLVVGPRRRPLAIYAKMRRLPKRLFTHAANYLYTNCHYVSSRCNRGEPMASHERGETSAVRGAGRAAQSPHDKRRYQNIVRRVRETRHDGATPAPPRRTPTRRLNIPSSQLNLRKNVLNTYNTVI